MGRPRLDGSRRSVRYSRASCGLWRGKSPARLYICGSRHNFCRNCTSALPYVITTQVANEEFAGPQPLKFHQHFIDPNPTTKLVVRDLVSQRNAISDLSVQVSNAHTLIKETLECFDSCFALLSQSVFENSASVTSLKIKVEEIQRSLAEHQVEHARSRERPLVAEKDMQEILADIIKKKEIAFQKKLDRMLTDHDVLLEKRMARQSTTLQERMDQALIARERQFEERREKILAEKEKEFQEQMDRLLADKQRLCATGQERQIQERFNAKKEEIQTIPEFRQLVVSLHNDAPPVPRQEVKQIRGAKRKRSKSLSSSSTLMQPELTRSLSIPNEDKENGDPGQVPLEQSTQKNSNPRPKRQHSRSYSFGD